MGKKKKSKPKHRPAVAASKPSSHSASEALATQSTSAEVEWPEDVESQNRLLTVLKYQTLGPFLFAQRSLTPQAEMCAVEAKLLPRDEGVWPLFFEKKQWRKAVLVVQVVLTSIHLCETNQSFRDYLLKGHSPILKESMVARLLKMHSKSMGDYSSTEVEVMYKVLRLQVLAMAMVGVSSPAYLFLEGLREKDQLVLPIQERGNANFKESRYRAAIGDFTRAIRISPYSAVLYCNRALCYIKNGDIWNACVDSYRALVLKPQWGKPYYRCSQSWMLLGNHSTALSINGVGCEKCSSNSDLQKQRREIQAALEKLESSASAADGDGDKAKEKPSRTEKGDCPADGLQTPSKPETVNGSAAETCGGENGMSDEVGSDPEDITELRPMTELTQDIDHYKTTVVGPETTGSAMAVQASATGGDKVLEREPIEDDNEWEYRHTALPTRPTSETGIESVKFHDLQNMFSMDKQLLTGGESSSSEYDFSDYEDELLEKEAAKARIQNEARELAAYKQKEKEREKMKTERQAMRTTEERKLAHTLPTPDPFTQFETLQAPKLDVDISTVQLFSMMKQVPKRQLNPLQYTAHSDAWHSMEPLPPLNPLIRPKPPADSFSGTFDEVWCPMLADVLETADIIPPRIHYVGNMVTKYIAHHPPHYRRYEL